MLWILERFSSLPGEKFPHTLPARMSFRKTLPLFLSHRAATFSDTNDGSSPHWVPFTDFTDNLQMVVFTIKSTTTKSLWVAAVNSTNSWPFNAKCGVTNSQVRLPHLVIRSEIKNYITFMYIQFFISTDPDSTTYLSNISTSTHSPGYLLSLSPP